MIKQPEIPVRVVVCAAVQIVFSFKQGHIGDPPKPMIICSARHWDMVMHRAVENLDADVWALRDRVAEEQGFIDQWGVFMDRKQASMVATAAGQINTRRPKSGNPNSKELFSEDLY